MSNLLAWLLFLLGIAHMAFGLVTFKTPLTQVWSDGFFGQFKATEVRRTAFWFMIFGPLLMGVGHAAIHAVAVGDAALLTLISRYAFVISLIGVAAFPKSPFLVSLVLSLLLLAAGSGWI